MRRQIDFYYFVIVASLFAALANVTQPATGEDNYPIVAQLPASDQLPNPFQFFGIDRRVRTCEGWEQR